MKKAVCLMAAFGVLLGAGGCQAGPEQSPPPETQAPIPTSTAEPAGTPGPASVPHTYEVTASVCDGLPEFRFVASGLSRGTGGWDAGYVTCLAVYDETGAVLLSADFSEGRD